MYVCIFSSKFNTFFYPFSSRIANTGNTQK